MRLVQAFTLTLLCSTVFVPTAFAADEGVVFLMNRKNPTKSISKGRAKAIYLGNYAFWSGVVPIKVLMRKGSIKASKVFLTEVVDTSAQKFDRYWTSRQLAGKGVKPKTVGSLNELLESLKKNPGAVGFALKSELAGVDLSGLKALNI